MSGILLNRSQNKILEKNKQKKRIKYYNFSDIHKGKKCVGLDYGCAVLCCGCAACRQFNNFCESFFNDYILVIWTLSSVINYIKRNKSGLRRNPWGTPVLRLQVNETEVGLTDISDGIDNNVFFLSYNFFSTISKPFYSNISIVNKLSCLGCCYRDIMVQLPSPGPYRVFFLD